MKILKFMIAGSLMIVGLMSSALADVLEGDFQGKIKLGTGPIHNGILHIRKIRRPEGETLIAVLATAEKDRFGEILPYQFNRYVAGDHTGQGFFSLERLNATNGVGTQVVALEVDLDNSGNVIHGIVTSNLIVTDGSLVEGEFDFRRRARPTPLG